MVYLLSGVVDVTIDTNHGNVVVQVAGVEFVVDEQVFGIEFNVGVKLRVLVDVPFAQADPQLLRSVISDAMSRGQQVRSVNERTSAEIHVVKFLLLQNGHLPGVLAELGLAVVAVELVAAGDAPGDAKGVSAAALSQAFVEGAVIVAVADCGDLVDVGGGAQEGVLAAALVAVLLFSG